MLGRTIQLNVVKKRTNDETASDEPTIKKEDVAQAVAFTDVVGKKILKAVATYIALDTARRIAVSRLGK